jgi:hypothetical protein
MLITLLCQVYTSPLNGIHLPLEHTAIFMRWRNNRDSGARLNVWYLQMGGNFNRLDLMIASTLAALVVAWLIAYPVVWVWALTQ